MIVLSLFIFFLAWFFQAFTGFGAGIFIVGVLSIFYDPKTVIVSSAVVNLIGTLFMSFLLMKRVKPRLDILFTLILGSVPGILMGSYALLLLNRESLRLLIGLFIFILGIYDFLVQIGVLYEFSLKKSFGVGVGFGFLGGFFAGLIGIGGPPPVVYLNQILGNVDEFKSTLTLFFISNILFRITSYCLQGGADLFDLNLILSSAITVPLGVYLGLFLSRRIKVRKLKLFVSLSVVLLGVALVLKPQM